MKAERIYNWGGAVIAAASMISAPICAAQDEEAPAAGAVDINKQLVGYWVVDSAKMMAIAVAKAEASGEKIGDEETAMIKQMIKVVSQSVVLEFKGGGKAIAHTPEGEKKATFKLTVKDAAKGKFAITVKAEGEEEKTGKGTLRGDKLMIKVDGEAMHMNRISEEEFKTRKAKIENFDPNQLFGAEEIAPKPGKAPAPPED